MQFGEAFQIKRKAVDDWFDVDLKVDTKLFIDPFLLLQEESVANSEWSDAHAAILTHFSRCYELVAKGGAPKSIPIESALSLLTFPEPDELGLGYTSGGTRGSGGGKARASIVLASIVEAIARGIRHPTHIEDIGILNEGIGADGVSDAAANILKPKLIAYTQAVAARHKIPTHDVLVKRAQCDLNSGRWISRPVALPVNPFSGRAILLVPKRFLNNLPVLNADDWFDSTFNADLRRELNVEIGQRVPKREIARFAKRHPERIRAWADALRQNGTPRSGYDFDGDPLGVSNWQSAGSAFGRQNPLGVTIATASDLVDFVNRLMEKFKMFIEHQSGWKLLWNDDGSEKPEEAAQLVFLGMTREYARALGVEIDREVNLGRGPVDFKITGGPGVRLLVEVKKLHNGDFWNGLEHQLPSYLASDGTREGWFLAIQYRTGGVSASRPPDLVKRVAAANKSLGTSIGFSLVDARPKNSASNIGSQGDTKSP